MTSGENWTPYEPLVSVVLPTFDRAAYLPLAVDSVLSAPLDALELIIVDDGSTDETAAYVAGLDDDRIISIRQSHRGEYVATNLGLRAAAGAYVTWLHSDDLLPVDSLGRRVALLEERADVDLVHGDIEFIDERGNVISPRQAFDGTASSAFVSFVAAHRARNYDYPMHHTTMMFRRELLSRVGYLDESLPTSGDLDWTVRALTEATIAKVEGNLYRYRRHAGTKREADKATWDRHEVNSRIYGKHVERIDAMQADAARSPDQ